MVVDHRVEFGELLRQLHIVRLVDALAQLGLQVLPALQQLVELLGGYGGHGEDQVHEGETDDKRSARARHRRDNGDANGVACLQLVGSCATADRSLRSSCSPSRLGAVRSTT